MKIFTNKNSVDCEFRWLLTKCSRPMFRASFLFIFIMLINYQIKIKGEIMQEPTRVGTWQILLSNKNVNIYLKGEIILKRVQYIFP